ncbi:MAG: hypothetical protein P4L84_11705 [Isosphaeraceae bacterium]|nr:hypothetical protein [Isosphaeraceae bacterium]
MTALLVTLLLLAPRAEGDAAPPAVAETAGEVRELVYLHDDRPLFLRLRVRIGDQSHQEKWRETMAHLFRNLDADNNGIVTPQELNRGGWLERMRSESGLVPNRRGAMPATPTLKPESLAATRDPDELARELRSLVPALVLQGLPKQNDGSENLFERLDRDGDRKLSQPELEAAADALAAHDEDDDEMIRASELKAYRSPFFGEGVPQPGPFDPESVPLVLAVAGEPRARLASRLIKRYDIGSRENPREKDRKLARFEIGLDDTTFLRADADADGALDAEELARFLDDPAPHLEVTITVATDAKGKTTIEPSSPQVATPFLAQGLRRPSPGKFDLCDDHIQVEFCPGPPSRRPGFDLREFYKNQFAAADADGSKAINKQESARNGVFNNNFDLMDRDADGKLTEAELLGFVDEQLELAQSRVALMVTDQGHALFDALDTNRDRRLGARELRTALGRLADWDLDSDGQLAQNEIPQHFRLTIDHAQPALLIRVGNNPFDEERNGAGPTVHTPAWFLKMDVNHDGDLSPREFLGTASDFRRLDADGDGLIDGSEAARPR